ncbi:MAG: aminotransferase class III-fold pyridoxal phosphate-dependent enzyme [Roseitalea sp.]|nr:aminotransferase class III-fold pyridoxal phosphate-dependent enzyme [Roseitalea sp.]MBO6950451.1 aminotransferase class III-fold pyridoxal phosphate-dependent enzyme [Rhizobiaceae bacterium]MBO6591561.1 aminotransferase class III-fold pyridoxal phosphate-dependent enzyme [Roseitalea sp.]MBO6599416.1 aminotransferase class III-fold pyridoxal phosphate-dependent enzyme [Roseitalea sp.]MBO6612095.1 aminotransferase class III-fold pyridoxal phosphate-dependent enzyme [Roseitalea sp.]
MADAHSNLDALREDDVSSLLHPFTNAVAHGQIGPDVVVRGEGARIYDDAGREYIDAMSGLWAIGLGYSEERLINAATEQLKKLPYYHTFAHKSNPAAIKLGKALLSMLPVEMSKVIYTNSGSEAVDTAIKLAWYYWNAAGEPERVKIISRKRAYHGSNVASGSATGLPVMHGGFNLPFSQILHAECPHFWRYGEKGETEEEFSQRKADELEKLILEAGPTTIAAFIAEPVMGAGGVIVPPEGYFKKIQAVLDRYGILFISDEVICGFGRTGKMFGSETFGIRPDIMTFAKQLSSAYMPIGAVTVTEELYEKIASASNTRGVFGHGYTYSGHPVACAVALEALTIYQERDVVGHVAQSGAYFQQRLREFESHPLVGEVRGVGLIAAVELVADKRSKKLFDPFGKVNGRFAKLAYERGLITRALPASDSLGLCPPLFCTKSELDEIVDKFADTLEAVTEFASRAGR